MSTVTAWQNEIVPAQLAHLAIYNPSLGPTDETFDQQLVFYFSRHVAQTKAAQKKSGGQRSESNNDEALRQIGLAQGLINFAKTFSNDEPVNCAETEQARLILHELESGWWIYASIDLTRIPSAEPSTSSTNKKTTKKTIEPSTTEYSSREVSPATLLTKQIAQAHSIFCLHHGPSLSILHAKLPRDRFCAILDRFWSRFAKTWDVLLHGNPVVDVLSGIKLASGGELGFGVGEEEWGSGEREVLEEMTQHTEGLVETIVVRFGDQAGEKSAREEHDLPWCGAGREPSVADGVVFGGVGKLSRPSLESVSLWMRQLYTFGDHAYGVRDNPSRERRKRRRKDLGVPDKSEQVDHQDSSRDVSRHATRIPLGDRRDSQPQASDHVSSVDHAEIGNLPVRPGIPPPIVSATEVALAEATRKAESNATGSKGSKSSQDGNEENSTTLGIPDQYMRYLTFGLSTLAKPSAKPAPSISRQTTAEIIKSQNENAQRKVISRNVSSLEPPKLSLLEPMPDGEILNNKIALQKRQENNGHFIIGLKGDLDSLPEDEGAELTEGSLREDTEGHRTVLRTVHVEISNEQKSDNDSDTILDNAVERQPARLRVLVYARRPFLYCFLFEQRTSSLGYASFYRSIHRNLGAVHKALLSSTRASNVADRLSTAMDPLSKESDPFRTDSPDTPIYDLLYDPSRLTVHASLPNIPDPGTLAAEALSDSPNTASWSRLEALSVHSAILNTLESTLRKSNEIERVSKTGRGWWIIWMKIPLDEKQEPEFHSSDCRTAFIVRKASDAIAPYKASVGSRAVSGMWNTLTLQAGQDSEIQSHEKIAGLDSSGVGFDARKYVESILSLNR